MFTLFACTLAAFLSLCVWQISRGAEKEAIITQSTQKELLPATLISPSKLFIDQKEKFWETHLYSKNKIQGNWLSNNHYLQDNVTYDGIAGYEILTPFQALDGTVILANRGWISKKQYHFEKIALPATEKQNSNTTKELEGVWVLPTKRFTLGDTPYPEKFPKIVQQIDHEIIGEEIQQVIAPLQLRLSETPEHSFLQNHWKPVYGEPEKHYAYALQWFIFALILLFLFIKLNLRKIPKNI